MAKINSIAIGKASGSIGNVTFQSWKGIQTARQKPEVVGNPNTIKQQNQRNAMKSAVALFRRIAAVLAVGFKQMAVKMSAYNAFIQANLKSGAISFFDGTFHFDSGRFILSKGTLPKTELNSCVYDSGLNTVTVQYPTNTLQGQSDSDVISMAVISHTGQVVGAGWDLAQRDEGVYQLDLEVSPLPNANYYVYTFFRNPVTGEVSDSVKGFFVKI